MNILVTGATSLIGKEVVALLLKNGHAVRIITRQKTVPLVLQNSEIITGDLEEIGSAAAEGIDTVIHIAAATPGAGSSLESYFKTNVDGTRHLIDICKEKKVNRFIHISSIVVLYKENTDPYSDSKRQAEEILKASDLNWTILRPAEIIGADKSWDRFLQLLKNKKYVFVPGNGMQHRHPVFFRDVVKAIIQVMDNKATFGKCYSLAAATPVGYYQFLLTVRKIFGGSFSIIKVPLWIIKSFSVFNFIMPAKVKRKIKNAHGMLRGIEVNIQNAVTDFNYKPYDLENGLMNLKEEMDSQNKQ